MYKISKILLPAVAVSMLAACSQSDSVDAVVADVFDKSSIALNSLNKNVVEYENAADQTKHTDVYCPDGFLGDAVGTNGTWSVSGNDLAVNNLSSPTLSFTYMTTNARLEKNKTYDTATGEKFKVLKISTSISCG